MIRHRHFALLSLALSAYFFPFFLIPSPPSTKLLTHIFNQFNFDFGAHHKINFDKDTIIMPSGTKRIKILCYSIFVIDKVNVTLWKVQGFLCFIESISIC